MRRRGAQRETPAEAERATTVELFLDLVFVFTVTQLTELVAHPSSGAAYLHAALILAVTWWMYDGYVWLSGNIDLNRPLHRIGVFAGMGGFMLMALAIPTAFGPTAAIPTDSGIAFGLAYLFVTVVHATLFLTSSRSTTTAVRRITPFNLAGAGAVLLAGFVPEDLRWALWLTAIVCFVSSSLFGRLEGFSVSSSHFVERHGLVIIVALGESVVAIGVGATGRRIDVPLAATVLLGLALSAALWWVYFDRDDIDADRALTAVSDERRSRLALLLGYAHMVMIAGIVLVAAGLEKVVAHPTQPLDRAGAWNLAAGLTIYLIGEAAFRRSLALHARPAGLVAAAVALATVPIGTSISGVAQLAAATLLVVLAVIASTVRAPRAEA